MDKLWFVILFTLWTAFLFGGFVFGKTDMMRIRRMPAWTRMASSFVLVIVAWSGYLVARNSTASTYALLTAIGMTLGFVGDLFMAQLLPVKDYVLDGIGAFGLGHIAYIVAFVSFGNQEGLDGERFGAVSMWLLIGLAGWYIVVFRNQIPTPLHWAALPYALLLASAAGFASGLALQSSAFIPLALGTALFLLSDLFLAARLFNNLHFYLIDDAVWLLYGPAQMLIVYSTGTAIQATLA
jgi:hypothetical protein